MYLALISTLALIPTFVEVDVDPSSVPCPLEESVPAAIRRLSPSISSVAESASVPSLRIEVRALANDHVKIRYLSDDRLFLEREIEHRLDACAPLADTIALILDRHLTEIDWWREPVLPIPNLTPAPSRPSAPTTSSSEADDPSVRAADPETRETAPRLDEAETDAAPEWLVAARTLYSEVDSALDLGLQLMGHLGAPQPITPGIAVGAWGSAGILEATLGVGISAPIGQDILEGARQRGRLVVWTTLLYSRVGLCGEPFGRLCGDLGGGAERLAGWVEGDGVFEGRTAAQWLPFGFLGASWIYDQLTVVHPLLAVRGLWRPFPGGFRIVGATSDHSASPFGIQISLGVRANFL